MSKRRVVLLCVLAFVLCALVVVVPYLVRLQEDSTGGVEDSEQELTDVADPSVDEEEPTPELVVEELEEQEDVLPDAVSIEVPFISQAPNSEWNLPDFQDACEEASVLMAAAWLRGETVKPTPAQARQQIEELIAWQQARGRYTLDLSTEDTNALLQDYTGHVDTEVRVVEEVDDLRRELAKGNILILPMNGAVLPSPFYTAPGPERHMLVVSGYTADGGFVTQDPGTVTKGEDYVFAANDVVASIRDFPSGYHAPITRTDKLMIVVRPADSPVGGLE